MLSQKPVIPTPVKNIDKILNAIYQEQGLNYEDTKTKSGVLSDEETEVCLIKLWKDEYIIVRDKNVTITHANVRNENYMASYGGVIHKLKGGYEGEILNAFVEKNLNQRVANDQINLASKMNRLTFLLMIVAVPAALLSLADLYWHYQWFQWPSWWGMIGLNIVVSASISYGVWQLLQWVRRKKSTT